MTAEAVAAPPRPGPAVLQHPRLSVRRLSERVARAGDAAAITVKAITSTGRVSSISRFRLGPALR